MKVMWMIIFFVLPIVGMSYVLWHIWQMLPWSNPWRWTAVGIWGRKVPHRHSFGICGADIEEIIRIENKRNCKHHEPTR